MNNPAETALHAAGAAVGTYATWKCIQNAPLEVEGVESSAGNIAGNGAIIASCALFAAGSGYMIWECLKW